MLWNGRGRERGRGCEVNVGEIGSERLIALQEQYDEEAEDERKEEEKDKSKAESMIICWRIWRQHIDACTHRCKCQ
jgi:hypothetical protein